jgi:hypothetical protein
MENSDLLLTIAEIGVAFAGFASIVSVLTADKSERRALGQSILFRTMVLMSLMVVAFSLLPFVTHSFGVRPPASWRVASGVFLCVGSFGLFTATRWIRNARSAADPIRGTARLVALVDIPALVALVLLAASTLGLSGPYSSDSYVAALLLFLLGSGVCFTALLFSSVYPLTKPPAA